MEPTRPKNDGADPALPMAENVQPETYEKPTLTNYGPLTRLTRSSVGSLADAKGARRMACL